jgi:uncharacterized membrane protein (DUF485 family)
MDPSLHDVWVAAESSPFRPSIAKDSQFTIGFGLLLLGLAFSGVFALSPSALNVPVIGVPASLALAFGVVYMFCAVGVYV